MTQAEPYPVVLTIAGSDSGGGAGIQADLKTCEALGVFGTSALTCITAQNPDTVAAVAAVAPETVARQIEAVAAGFPVAAAKTGMLYSAEIIRAVSAAVAACGVPNLVVDPVMVSTSGARLLREDAVAALCEALLPQAAVVTPNTDEAAILCGAPVEDVDGLERAARAIGGRFGVPCVCKGGHLAAGAPGPGAEVVNVLCEGGRVTRFRAPRVAAAETHGTGCTFSAAVAAYLARGRTLAEAVAGAGAFTAAALRKSAAAGRHRPLAWARALRRG
ncbi:MAG: bifunctional hydroxymethylpyrimidine kinase/phosphomethylpyrimidine kinase [Lentisphaerae bacterium]|nr:bifunctional hydroxymethylpyrimidine kinase/phosphomethylpyrimidine kinase [Lentisphaerota bacterium]